MSSALRAALAMILVGLVGVATGCTGPSPRDLHLRLHIGATGFRPSGDLAEEASHLKALDVAVRAWGDSRGGLDNGGASLVWTGELDGADTSIVRAEVHHWFSTLVFTGRGDTVRLAATYAGGPDRDVLAIVDKSNSVRLLLSSKFAELRVVGIPVPITRQLSASVSVSMCYPAFVSLIASRSRRYLYLVAAPSVDRSALLDYWPETLMDRIDLCDADSAAVIAGPFAGPADDTLLPVVGARVDYAQVISLRRLDVSGAMPRSVGVSPVLWSNGAVGGEQQTVVVRVGRYSKLSDPDPLAADETGAGARAYSVRLPDQRWSVVLWDPTRVASYALSGDAVEIVQPVAGATIVKWTGYVRSTIRFVLTDGSTFTRDL